MRDDVSKDIEIDLQMSWEHGDNYQNFDGLPPTPRQRWHERMAKAWKDADDAERISLAIEYRRVAKLEMECLRSGGMPHLLGTDRDPRSHCRTTEVPEAVGLSYVPRTAVYDAAPPSQSACASMSADQEFQLQQRMLASYRNRGHW